ncbi:AAA family ATPase [Salibacterium aidingense]|uniref:AAA family ATPase n=1 Tax=Salibacterium aidingense TaxID=384933 RepID=UPI00047ECE52|nr:AAA family ATPase [Salibacterium aidingense]
MEKQGLHVVFPSHSGNMLEYITADLEDLGYPVLQTDTSLDTMADWAQSADTSSADCALIYGLSITSRGQYQSDKEASYHYLKTIRLNREDMRLIVLFPEEVKHDYDFISKIAQLNIYDIYFINSLRIEDIEYWIENKKGFQHVERILSDYHGRDDDVTDTPSYDSYDTEEATDLEEEDADGVPFTFQEHDTLPDKFRKRKLRDRLNKKKEREPPQPSKENQSEREEKTSTMLKNISGMASSLAANAKKQKDSKPKTTIQYEYRTFSSKVIVIAGTKGGVGKTDIALNVAASIKEQAEVRKMCVVDFSFPYGSIAQALQLQRTIDLSEWKNISPSLTEKGVNEKVITDHDIDFVPLPVYADAALSFDKKDAEGMLYLLKKFYDVIVIDASGYHAPTRAALEWASDIILVTNHDVAGISNGLTYRNEMVHSFGIDHEKISVFINQIPKSEDITKQTIAELFEDHDSPIPVIGYAPYDDLVRQSRNNGYYIYYDNPTHSFSLGMDMILEALELISPEVIRRKKKEKVGLKFQSMFKKERKEVE